MTAKHMAASAAVAVLLIMLAVSGVAWPTTVTPIPGAQASARAQGAQVKEKSDEATAYAKAAAQAVRFAQEQVGKPYIAGTRGPHAYDCSGLTWAAWAHAGLPWSQSMALSYYQWNPKGFGVGTLWTVPVKPGQEQPGDLVFFDWYHNSADAPRGLSGPGGVDHVGIVEDPRKGTMIEAANPNAGVIRSYYREGGNARAFIGFSRVVSSLIR